MPLSPVDRRLRLCVVQLDGVLYARTTNNRWLPAEPLIDPNAGNNHCSDEPTGLKLFTSDTKHIYDEVQQLCTTETHACLTELLDVLVGHNPDLVVFPEYQVPLDFVPSLVEFSEGRAVVAGLGYVRNPAEAAALVEHAADGSWTSENLVGRNVSVLVENQCVHLITKRSIAENELAEAGTGPLVRDVMLRDRQTRVGVAVCMDYLLHGNDTTLMAADIVCIPANSTQVRPFQPDQPRDHVRLLANSAVHGGSQIMAAGLRGALTNPLGVQPIPAGYQGVILVEYDRSPAKPSNLLTSQSSLLVRAEIVEKTPDNDGALQVIAELAAVDVDSPPEDLHQLAAGWREQLNGSGGPLGQALDAYEDALAQDFVDHRMHNLARTHFPVQSGRRRDGIRSLQAQVILKRLQELDSSVRGANVGAATDAYQRLIDSLPAGTVARPRTQPAGAAVAVVDDSPEPSNPPPAPFRFISSNARDGTRSELVVPDPALGSELARKLFESMYPDPQSKGTL
jgi:predicted amidohydrolase